MLESAEQRGLITRKRLIRELGPVGQREKRGTVTVTADWGVKKWWIMQKMLICQNILIHISYSEFHIVTVLPLCLLGS